MFQRKFVGRILSKLFIFYYIYIYIYIYFQISALCEITRKIIVEPGRPQNETWCMPIAFWVPRATNTHPECVILIAFPLQQ